MYKRIAIAVDSSEHALRATRGSIRLTNVASIVELIYVADIDKAHHELLHMSSPDALLLARRQLLQPFETLLQTANRHVKTTILKGQPAQTLIDYVNKKPIELLVIGSHGLHMMQQMMLGSVSHKVIKHVHCPVLVVK